MCEEKKVWVTFQESLVKVWLAPTSWWLNKYGTKKENAGLYLSLQLIGC